MLAKLLLSVFPPLPYSSLGVATREHDCSTLVEEILGPRNELRQGYPSSRHASGYLVLCMSVLVCICVHMTAFVVNEYG